MSNPLPRLASDTRLLILAFAVGIVLCQQLAELPAARWLWTLPAWLLSCYFRPVRLFAVLVMGLLWAMWRADWVLAQQLAPELQRQDVILTGTIDSLPHYLSRRVRFNFTVDSLRFADRDYPTPGRIRLSWYTDQMPALHIGQRWQFSARLKRPHTLHNPGTFDYSAWLFTERIRAVGYVRKEATLLAAAAVHSVPSWRERLYTNVSQALPDNPAAALIAALALGERQGIRDDQWEVLRLTGTTHLMAISGLHIGWIAGCGLWLGRLLGRYSGRLLLYVPKQFIGAGVALLVAFAYALLAGFAIPTQRAFIMIATLIVALLLGRSRSISHALSLALLLVLLWSPLAVLVPGLWLSFGAVAALLYAFSGRIKIRWAWAKMHVVVIVGLSPVLLAWFGQVPLLSPLANLVAVPWVGLLVVPQALLGTLLTELWPTAGQVLLDWCAINLDLLWVFLNALSQHTWGILERPPAPWWALLCALVGVLWMLAPAGFPRRWLGMLWLLPALFTPRITPPSQHAWFHLLDVGQGLAAIVQTQQHVLVYDSGPYFSSRFDAGADIIAAVLNAQGISQIDRLVISHDDNDHAGGTDSLRATLTVPETFAGMPEMLEQAQACRSGQQWQWDGIQFEFFHPPPNSEYLPDNNRSCVLKVSSAGASVLLTGDIEKDSEAELVRRVGERLRADILVAPHHGSRTSSSAILLQAVHPRYGLFSSGYLNRFGFPKPDVLARYHAIGAETLNTADTGAIRFTLQPDGLSAPSLSRETQRRYWQD